MPRAPTIISLSVLRECSNSIDIPPNEYSRLRTSIEPVCSRNLHDGCRVFAVIECKSGLTRL